MRLSRAKYGSVGVVCLSLFLSSAIGIAMAQEPGEQKEAASGNPTVAAAESNEGTMYYVPLVPMELQKQGNTATPSNGTGLQGNFLERLGSFYKEDWTGKLPSSPTPPRRALDAPLDSTPFPSSDWGCGGASVL